MPRVLVVCALLLGSMLTFGCSQKNPVAEAPRYSFEEDGSLVENDPVTGHKLVRKAKSAIGTPYVLGGSNPGGFDCSGLVKWAYDSVGVKLPRTAREQSVVGKKVKNVEDMRAGDIVAFRHPRRGYHTGIYLGDGKFVHSPRKRSSVKISSLDEPYFSSTLLGARRVSLDGSENLIAQAEERLSQYMSQKEQGVASSKTAQKSKRTAKSGKHAVKKGKHATKAVAEKKAVKTKSASKTSATRTSLTRKSRTGKVTPQKGKIAANKTQEINKKAAAKAVSMVQNKKAAKARGRNS